MKQLAKLVAILVCMSMMIHCITTECQTDNCDITMMINQMMISHESGIANIKSEMDATIGKIEINLSAQIQSLKAIIESQNQSSQGCTKKTEEIHPQTPSFWDLPRMLEGEWEFEDTRNTASTVTALEILPLPRLGDANNGSHFIWYQNANGLDIRHWVASLNDFMSSYEIDDYVLPRRTCSMAKYMEESDRMERTGIPRWTNPCEFNVDYLQQPCTKADKWGFESKSPCLILKVNKVLHWEPEVYKTLEELPELMPQSLKDHINSTSLYTNGTVVPALWVSCEGDHEIDQGRIGKIDLTPFNGFPAYYFPYNGDPTYISPLIGLIIHPQPFAEITVKCRMWAKNVDAVTYFRIRMD